MYDKIHFLILMKIGFIKNNYQGKSTTAKRGVTCDCASLQNRMISENDFFSKSHNAR